MVTFIFEQYKNIRNDKNIITIKLYFIHFQYSIFEKKERELF